MMQIMVAPGKYVQGPGAIREIGTHIARLGDKAMILGSRSGLRDCQYDLEKTLSEAGVQAKLVVFGGECSRHEIDRVNGIIRDAGSNVLLAVGGGKCIDTGKVAAHETGIPLVTIPTIASTDAPCTAVSVIYTEDDHVVESRYCLPRNPVMVVVDTEIIARAPARFLVAGMGDALATWFEADAATKSFSKHTHGGISTEAALALARLCFDMLMRYGRQAKLAAQMGAATVALDKIVEANTLLSGLGFESGGLAAAHAVHNGLTALRECHHLFHGEKVAFGTLTQLVLENREREEIEQVLDFCTDVGLPVTLRELGIDCEGEQLTERLMVAAAVTCAPGSYGHNEPFPVTRDTVVAAMKGADALGRDYFARTGKRPTSYKDGG